MQKHHYILYAAYLRYLDFIMGHFLTIFVFYNFISFHIRKHSGVGAFLESIDTHYFFDYQAPIEFINHKYFLMT